MDEKYISVTKFKESLAKLTVEGGTEATRATIARTLGKVVPQLLDDELSADVQPVRHGKWMARTSTRDSMKCSICGNSSKQPDRYCGCCGAKMDIIYEDDKIRAIKVTG